MVYVLASWSLRIAYDASVLAYLHGTFFTSDYFNGAAVNSDTLGVISVSVIQVSSRAPEYVALGTCV